MSFAIYNNALPNCTTVKTALQFAMDWQHTMTFDIICDLFCSASFSIVDDTQLIFCEDRENIFAYVSSWVLMINLAGSFLKMILKQDFIESK